MKCTLCETELEAGTAECPNCGNPVGEESVDSAPWMNPDWSTLGRGQGILYENLSLSQEDDGEVPPKKVWRYTLQERLQLIAGFLMLALILGAVYFLSRGYDPNAAAIIGRQGIRMDNRTFAIYYLDAKNQMIASCNEAKKPLPFDAQRSLSKQYWDLEAGITWSDYFIAQAESKATATLCLLADAQRRGFTPEGETAEKLEQIPQMLERSAAYSGFVDEAGNGSVAAFVETRYGTPVTGEAYCGYFVDTMYAQAYFNQLIEELGGEDQATVRISELAEEFQCELTRFAVEPK